MLEMLLTEQDDVKKRVSQTVTLDQIMKGEDPLDDILNHLTSGSTLQAERKMSVAKPYAVKELPEFPTRKIDFSAPSSKVEAAYLAALNDVLENTSLADYKDEMPEEVFMAVLEEVIHQRGDVAVALPPMPSKPIEHPPVSPTGKYVPPPVSSPASSLDINYLDLLEDMVSKEVKPSLSASPSRPQSQMNLLSADTKAGRDEEILNKLILAQDDKLKGLLNDFVNVDERELAGIEPRFDFPWESSTREFHMGTRLGISVSVIGEVFRAVWRNQGNFVNFKF